jgi:carbon-monoxide dehydrogenase large subunit
MVVAMSTAAAQDAAEKIAVDYRPIKAVTDVREAAASGAPQLWPEAPGNIAFDWTAPVDPDGKKKAALEGAFREAAHVVRVELINQRLVVGSLEPRSATASYDPEKRVFTLRCPTQGVANIRGQIAGSMNVKPEELHVLTDDVGGAFGMKGASHPEYIALLHAARAQQAGALAVDALGGLPQRLPRPRLVLDRRARAEQTRQVSRVTR